MLGLELSGRKYNKAEHNRALQALTGRSHGSVERKHQNISAILIELGFPYVDGYKPLGNYQEMLREIVADQLSGSERLIKNISENVSSPAAQLPEVPDLLKLEVSVPKRDQDFQKRLAEKPSSKRTALRRNYLEIEASNRSLGLAGEKLILAYEHERLWKAGRRELADRIEHVSQTKGDGLGYDIQSYETDGKELFIEVKNTRFGALTPFFATRNEISASEEYASHFRLCRLFDFNKNPRFFALGGPLRSSCQLDPVLFSVLPR
ncbi:MAG TPA: DUF3883 domain-containing protein [Terrimicrobiaceae bacterium]|nr:DUF3883 domain-containing protein [Terrimicrobiaceae bacterium]